MEKAIIGPSDPDIYFQTGNDSAQSAMKVDHPNIPFSYKSR